MNKFKNIDQVWEALDQGKIVYWKNESYQLTIEPVQREWRERQGFGIPWTTRGESCLRVTCMSNWFGSLLETNELNSLYTK